MSNATKPLDGAAALATVRAAMVSKIMGYLGSSREVDAERLADRMMDASRKLYEASLPVFSRAGADEQLVDRITQFNARAWQIVLQTMMDTLAVATARLD